MADTLKYFIYILTIQLFYSFGMTTLSYGLTPLYDNDDVTGQYVAIKTDMEDISGQIDNTMSSQLNIPVIDMGALVFYSGNVLIDLMMNFITALPSMVSLLLNVFGIVFSLDAFLMTQLRLYVFTFMSILYVISLIIFLMNIRSGSSGIV